MLSEPAHRLVIVCEADADRRIACALADRVLCEKVDWLRDCADQFDFIRAWQGLRPGDLFLRWHNVPDEARKLRIRVHGFGTGDGVVVRQALRVVKHLAPSSSAVVIVRDTDGRRQADLRQARDREAEEPWPFAVVVGLVHPKREAWVLSGFDPRSADEAERLASQRQALGFDPREHADRLTASRGDRKPGTRRDAKQVLEALGPGDEAACWMETDLALLRRRGQRNGLADFLVDVEARLAPLFQPTAP